MDEKLTYYIHCFTRLRRDSKNGGAPHKPILLLSLINLFSQNIYHNSEIKNLPELVAAFKSNWSKLVETNHNPIFALPFYHMKSEPFWTLLPNLGCEKWLKSKGSIRSLSNLQTAINCAIIDNELVELLVNKEYRDILKTALIEKYFPNKLNCYVEEKNLFSANILHEDSEIYKNKIVEMKRLLDSNEFEEEVYVRSGIFKREIPKLYNNSCAISGLRIDATSNISMIDACHIVPFSEDFDDSISNGIALCPNLHRAFDRGLILISNNYRVTLSKNFIENKNSDYSISQFENSPINLPEDSENYPSLENLSRHRERFENSISNY